MFERVMPLLQSSSVGATFKSPDGVVLVDKDYCIGCRYCIQACPYGARYLDPVSRTAEKCTFCYHRLVKGLKPACVEVCPNKSMERATYIAPDGGKHRYRKGATYQRPDGAILLFGFSYRF